jgi:hypothetical protein
MFIQRQMISALLAAVDLSAGEVDPMPLWHCDATVICFESRRLMGAGVGDDIDGLRLVRAEL